MNPFAMAFANSYLDGEKLRPDLATTYQNTNPQPDYGFSLGGQAMGQTASQAPMPSPYVPEQSQAYNNPASVTQSQQPGFAFGGQSMGQTAADAKDQYGFSQKQYDDIKANWNAYRSDPNKIMGLMRDYGVDAAALSRATGVGFDEIGNYLRTNGAQNGFGGYSWSNPQQQGQGQTSAQGSQQTYTPNPYLGQMAGSITDQVRQNLQRNILPSLSSGAHMTGGYGGSRQGVLEANALNDANKGLSNSLASLYYGDYNNAMNRNLQQQSLDNSFNLGLGNLGLGAINAQNSFYTSQRGQDLQQAGLGAQLMQMGNQNYLGAGQGIANLGTSQQQAPWQVIGNMNNSISPFTGFGSTTSSQNSNPWASALGGAIGLGQIGKLW